METPFKKLSHMFRQIYFMTTWSWIKFFWFQDHEINFHQKILKKMCKTYDVNIREAVHNNFWWNIKQLPRVLKSNYSKRFLKIPEKSSVSSFSNVLSVDRQPAILIKKACNKSDSKNGYSVKCQSYI